MKILLTGATGFLGSSVTLMLAGHGHHVVALQRASSNLDNVKQYVADVITGDVTDPVLVSKAASGMDAIVHMAADLSHWSRHRDRIFRTNVIGTRCVAEAAKTAGVPKLLHVSSVAAVGYSVDGTPINETAPNNFVPLRLVYHESKRLAEEEAADALRYGVHVVIVNPGVLYGPRDISHTFGHPMLELAAGRIPGHPSGGISVTDVEDAARGVVSALDLGRSGERYLLTGHNLTYAQIFERQSAAVSAHYKGRTLPATLMQAAARVFEFRSRFTGAEPRLTRDNAKIAPLLMWYDSSKAARELDYYVRPLEATLERMASAYRRAGLL